MRFAFVAAVAALALAGCGGGGGSKAPQAQGTTTQPQTQPQAKVGPCAVKGKPVTFTLLDAKRKYTVTAQTSLGTFAFSLDVKDSPCTTSSFASLVHKHFFDGLTFHRIVHGFVIQGGDPKGDGTGGAGHSLVGAPPRNAADPRRVVP